MKIEMAQHSGFCMGVKSAILKIVDELNASEEQILMYGPLIHNPQTIEVLKKRGLITINSLDKIEGRQIAIRTHGVPLEENRKIRREASRTINLTCPRVARVQSIIKKYSGSGYYTVIIGDRDHAEVIGLKSYAQSGVSVVSTKEDIESIPGNKKYIIVSQTTHERREFEELVNLIKKKHHDVLIIDTICDSTRLRQDDVIDGIRRGIDTLVVVGGKNSANTTRLAKIGTDNGIKTIHIETEEELNAVDFYGSEHILVTAGASTPGWIINNVLEKLYSIKNSNSNFIIKIFKQYFEFLVRSNFISALASALMVLIAQKYASLQPDIRFGIISFLYIFVMYSVNNYLDKDFLVKSNSYKYHVYKNYGRHLLFISIVFLIASLYLSYSINPLLVYFISLPYILGVIYSTTFVKSIIKLTGIEFLIKLYNTKIITGFGWLIVLILLPYFNNGVPAFKYIPLAFYFLCFIFLRQLLIDLVAYQGDLILGRDTLPTWIGIRKTTIITIVLFIVSCSALTASIVYYGLYPFITLVIPLLVYIVLLKKIESTDYLISLRYEFIIDANFVLLFIICLHVCNIIP